MPAPSTLPAPQVSGSSRSPLCAVPAPDVPEDVNVEPKGLSDAQGSALKFAVEAVFNARAFVDRVASMSPAQRSKAWNTGPFGQGDIAARVFLGEANDDNLAVVAAALGNVAATLSGRQPVTARTGEPTSYEVDGKLLTIAAPATISEGARAILTALMGSSGMRRSAKLVEFVFTRQGVAGDCLLSKEQV